MQHLRSQLEVLLFDYGNTLIEFGPAQVERCDRALSAAFERMFGPHDFDRLSDIQHRERRAPYSGEFLENDLAEVTRATIRELFGTEPTEVQIQHLLEVRFDVMTSCVRVAPEVHYLLERLRGRFRLGLVSNYPCARSIRHSLEQHELHRWFDVVVVSGEVGRVKPHPQVFEAALSRMQARPEATLFIGDNWLGDIQGAKRYGMKAALITQYVPYEKFPREPGDHEPDILLNHLGELAALCD